MRIFNIFILATSIALLSPISFADFSTNNSHAPMSIQIIQDQINLDSSLIKSASIITEKDGSYSGLEITLNDSASKELQRITSANIGKIASIVLNNKIVSSVTIRSSLSTKFLIAGVSKQDAQIFIDTLNK